MNTRLLTSLIIAAMVTLCMFALPGVAQQPSSPTGTAALSFTLPLNNRGTAVEVQASCQSLTWLGDEISTTSDSDCAQTKQPAANRGGNPFASAGLTSGLDMPFFSVAGLLDRVVSQ